MKVIVDTSVWSLAFRRGVASGGAASAVLRDLIADGRAVMMGVVRQEVLSGIRTPEQFGRLKTALRAFSDLEMATEDHEMAAEFFTRCRQKGVQGANTDFLICAAAVRREYRILTTDRDFARFAETLPIALQEPLP